MWLGAVKPCNIVLNPMEELGTGGRHKNTVDQDGKESWETELSIIAECDVFGTYHMMPQRRKQRSALGV